MHQRSTAPTRQAVGSGRAGCQGDADVNIRLPCTCALTLLGAVEAIGVATATAVCKPLTAARVGVVVPANEAATTRSH